MKNPVRTILQSARDRKARFEEAVETADLDIWIPVFDRCANGLLLFTGIALSVAILSWAVR
jgi:hypothetical protein